jgi:hypothetical protein
MNERVKKLSEEIRKLTPEEQAVLMDELSVGFRPSPGSTQPPPCFSPATHTLRRGMP